MAPSKLKPLVEHCARLPDPRVERTTRPLLLDIVVIAGCAVICGADTWVDIEEYGHAKPTWLKRFLPLPHGLPSPETFARVLARLEPEAFRPCFLAWLTEGQERLGGPLASPLVALDGKAARHRVARAMERGPLHMVRAWATAAHLVVGQVAVAQKSHESTASPTLLQLLELSGGIVTIDAMGTQKEMAKTIREREADSGLALKGHQGTLHEDGALLFEWADAQQSRDLVHMTYETHTTGHGREARRRTTGPNDMTGRRGYEDWLGLQSVAMGEAWRTQGEVVSYERRDYISSLSLDAQRMAESVRGPWAIENALHWVLAIAFREDDSRIRQGHAPENFARLRHIALNLLTQEKTNRRGVKVKRNRAGWDNDSLQTVWGI
jgi:predicted transposase YbfD/YdcC